MDPRFIIKQGYLVKSPPLDESTLIRKRWRFRWFVLCNANGDVNLFYYNGEKNVVKGLPKGSISLVGAEVYKHRGKLNGYSYVINIQTADRLYHLCATQSSVHEDWLEKIRDHYIPNTEMVRRSHSTHVCNRQIQSRQSLSDNIMSVPMQRQMSNQSRVSVTSNSDSEHDRTSPDHPVCLHTSIHNDRPCPLPPPHPVKQDNWGEYIGMGSFSFPKLSQTESEDEGIGRSDSETSNTTSTCTTRPLSYMAVRNSMHESFGDFVGPKLTPSRQISKSRSVGDLSILLPSDNLRCNPECNNERVHFHIKI